MPQKPQEPMIRSAYMKPLRVTVDFSNSPSLAKQSFKDECDINKIMRRYEKTGVVDHLNKFNGDYGSFLGFEDYHTSMNQILAAEEAFMALPAKVRARFNHSPAEFLQFAQNADNHEEMVELGLARRGEPEEPANPPQELAEKAPDEPAPEAP